MAQWVLAQVCFIRMCFEQLAVSDYLRLGYVMRVGRISVSNVCILCMEKTLNL